MRRFALLLMLFAAPAFATDAPVVLTDTPPVAGAACKGYPGGKQDSATGHMFACKAGVWVDITPAGTGSATLDPASEIEVASVKGRIIQKGPTFDVTAYGAKGDGTTDDTAAIQAAIDAAKVYTSTTYAYFKGASVYFPSGRYIVSSPLILPRNLHTSQFPTGAVYLVGAGPWLTTLQGADTFPTNRAMVEWEAVQGKAYGQVITGIDMILPHVSGTMAIHFQPTSKATRNALYYERLQLRLENVIIEPRNDYHAASIWLEGNVYGSTFRNVIQDPAPGTGWVYDTVLFKTDTTVWSATYEDSSGIEYSTFENIWSTFRNGGTGAYIDGRVIDSTMIGFHNAVGARLAPVFKLTNSFAVNLIMLENEGKGSQPQVLITDSIRIRLTNLTLGTPSTLGSGVGNAIEFHGVTDSIIDGKGSMLSIPSYSASGVKYITTDANSKRNLFLNLGMNATMANEITDGGVDNYFEGFNYVTGQRQFLGTRYMGAVNGTFTGTWEGHTPADFVTSANVLHTSGDETAAGVKTWSDRQVIALGATPARSALNLTANGLGALSFNNYAANNLWVGFDTDYNQGHYARSVSAYSIGKDAGELRVYCNGGLTVDATYTRTLCSSWNVSGLLRHYFDMQIDGNLSVPAARIKGATSGYVALVAPAVAGTNTLTLPARTADVATTTGTLTDGHYTKFDANGNIVDGGTSAGNGEVNIGENLGGGIANYAGKSGVNLQFNTFSGTDFGISSNAIWIKSTRWALLSELGFATDNTTGNVTTDHHGLVPKASGSATDCLLGTGAFGACPGGGGGEANTASTLGTGLSAYAGKSGVDLQFQGFAAADFDLDATNHIISIDDTKWATDAQVASAAATAENNAKAASLPTSTNYAAAATPGGAATGLACTTCVDSTDIATGAVTPAKMDVSADATTADATTGHHGLLPKLGGGTTNFLRADGTWAAPAGGGNMSNSGTPVAGQLGVWASATAMKGLSSVTVDDSGNISATSFTAADPGDGSRGVTGTQNTSHIGAPGAGKWALEGYGDEPWWRAGAAGASLALSYASKTETLTNKSISGGQISSAVANATTAAGLVCTTCVDSTDIADSAVTPAKMDVTADATTADATTGHHGLLPKLGGGTSNFLRADGTWAAPSGSGTVNSSTTGKLASYASDGTAVSGNAVTATVTKLTAGVPSAATAGTDYVSPSSTETLTNKTLDVEGTGNVITTTEKVWFAAAGCNNTTATSFYDLPTASPAVAACKTGTNTQMGVLDFADSAALSGQFTVALPADWTGNIDARIKWMTTATSGSVVWQIATICVADAETDDPAFNTASTVTDAAKGSTNQTNDAAIANVTATGCAAGELMHVKILRDAAHASDNLAATARLIGVELTFRRAQ